MHIGNIFCLRISLSLALGLFMGVQTATFAHAEDALSMAAPASGGVLSIPVDGTRVIVTPESGFGIFVADPLVAEVSSYGRHGTLLVTGVSYGSTLLDIIDAEGNPVARYTVEVGSGARPKSVTVYKGTARQSIACAPHCEPSIRTGDDADYTESVIRSISGRRNFIVERAMNAL